VYRKEGELLLAHPIRSYEGRADARAKLDEGVLACADIGDLLRCRAIKLHPLEEGGQCHTASQRLHRIKICSFQTQSCAETQEQLVAPDLVHELGEQQVLQIKIEHTSNGQRSKRYASRTNHQS